MKKRSRVLNGFKIAFLGICFGLSMNLAVSASCFAENFPTQPVARVEPWWIERHELLKRTARMGNVETLFVGDSITQGWNPRVWGEAFSHLRPANFGISGDKTENVLWRIQDGEFQGLDPSTLVLLIGTNNAQYHEPEAIRDGIAAVIRAFQNQMPRARILLISIFPRGWDRTDPLRMKVNEVNRLLPALTDGSRVIWVPIGRFFLDADERISPDIMPDSLHLSERGYRIFASALRPYL